MKKPNKFVDIGNKIIYDPRKQNDIKYNGIDVNYSHVLVTAKKFFAGLLILALCIAFLFLVMYKLSEWAN